MTNYEYEVQGNYGQGWEAVDTLESEIEAQSSKRTYDLEEPQYPHRVKRVKVDE